MKYTIDTDHLLRDEIIVISRHGYQAFDLKNQRKEVKEYLDFLGRANKVDVAKEIKDKDISQDIKTARRCLIHQGFICKNTTCLNVSCPLNRMIED